MNRPLPTPTTPPRHGLPADLAHALTLASLALLGTGPALAANSAEPSPPPAAASAGRPPATLPAQNAPADATATGLTSVTVYAAGDIARCTKSAAESGAAKTAALVAGALAKDKDAAVLVLGDSTYPDGTTAEFADCYGPTWGRFKARTHPSPGNHEYRTPGAGPYYDYFGAAAGPARRGYYSFKLGQWHMLSLNSNLKDTEMAAQLAWLKQDLDANKSACTLAYWHHPRFSSGGHGNSDRMKAAWEILHAAGADLVLAGHDHEYERFAPQDAEGRHLPDRGIRSFVVGTGGAGLTSFLIPRRNSELRENDELGVLKLELKPNGYTWAFLPTTGGPALDSGIDKCH